MRDIPLDKIMYLIAGLVISLLAAYLFGAPSGFLVGVLAGVAKWVADEYLYYGADYFDFYATVAGAMLGAIIYGTIGG